MSDSSQPRVERLAPDEAFALLGHGTRLGILQALGEDPDEPVPFSELRARVGEPDSGGFNYHLRKLVGPFVRETESGYELTIAGLQVVGAVAAGTYTAQVSMEPIDVDDPCPVCGDGPLRVTYEDELAKMRCTACSEWHSTFSVPPGIVEQYPREELPAAFDRWLWTLFDRITAGFCANCAGRLDGRLDPDGEDVRIRWDCERCGDRATASAVTPVLYHPVTVGFFADHGVLLRRRPSWRADVGREVESNYDGTNGTATVTVSLDGDVLTATLDPSGRVEAVERSDR